MLIYLLKDGLVLSGMVCCSGPYARIAEPGEQGYTDTARVCWGLILDLAQTYTCWLTVICKAGFLNQQSWIMAANT